MAPDFEFISTISPFLLFSFSPFLFSPFEQAHLLQQLIGIFLRRIDIFQNQFAALFAGIVKDQIAYT